MDGWLPIVVFEYLFFFIFAIKFSGVCKTIFKPNNNNFFLSFFQFKERSNNKIELNSNDFIFFFIFMRLSIKTRSQGGNWDHLIRIGWQKLLKNNIFVLLAFFFLYFTLKLPQIYIFLAISRGLSICDWTRDIIHFFDECNYYTSLYFQFDFLFFFILKKKSIFK